MLRPFPALAKSVALFSVFTASMAIAQEKKTVKTAEDLPRFSYPLSQPPSVLLAADAATFNAFARKVQADVDAVLAGYSIEDKATLRGLLKTREGVQLLTGDSAGALATSDQQRALQEKPEAKLTTDLVPRAAIAAQQETGASSGPAFLLAYQKQYAQEVNALPWALTQETVKRTRATTQTLSTNLMTSAARAALDPAVAKSGSLDFEGAQTLIQLREAEVVVLPVAKPSVDVLTTFIAAHSVSKPEIWAAREVTLTSADKLTPVRIAIFDSGVDTSLFPGLLFVDPKPGAHSAHGLAYDTQGNLYDGDLQPLTPEQKGAYARVLSVEQGRDDLQNGVDSPAAADIRKMLSSMPPDQLTPFLKQMEFFGQWMHGTHVAGIAVRGNPAARLVVVQFNDSLPDLPFAPTVAWAEHFKADFRQVGQYFRDNNVRVANMSWADSQGEIEQWLTRTSPSQDPEARKQLAAQVYAAWRSAVQGAIEAAPQTLFVCAAGNSDSNASFLGDVPASLHEPNLITVGAVDQAGDETSFTSYGDTVRLDADGYRVESYVPGGTRLKMSGTSMASPNVVNLAAKLIALNPQLTPAQTIALMQRGADASADGRLHLINPKATVALLPQQRAAR